MIEKIKEDSKLSSIELRLVRTINIMIDDLDALKRLLASQPNKNKQ